MRILIADSLPASCVETLESRGHACRYEPALGADELAEAIGDAQVLVVRSTRVPADVCERSGALELVIRAGAGTNTIDTRAASAAGIYVSNVPGRNAIAVAELAMGLILALDRKIPDAVADLRAGKWKKKTYAEADGLAGKTLGIVGVGGIGLELARRAAAFGVDVVAVHREGRPADVVHRAREAGVRFVATDEEMLAQSDIVSLHVPLNDETRDLVDDEFLAMCRDGAWIINTSRGEVVDEAALIRALDGRDMWAGVDVFKDEPSTDGDFSSALAAHPRVYGTHHIGASTEQAQQAVAEGVVDLIDAYAAGTIVNCVNLETVPRGQCVVVVRHLDRVGVLSDVLTVLRSADVNVAQMDNRLFRHAPTAVATIRTDTPIDRDLANRLREVEHVLAVTISSEE